LAIKVNRYSNLYNGNLNGDGDFTFISNNLMPNAIVFFEPLQEIYGAPMEVMRHAATGHRIAVPL
jgi:hypothetical protein